MKIDGIKSFSIKEFVPKGIWNRFRQRSIMFLDQKVVFLAQGVRDYFDRSVTINNWPWYQENGAPYYNYSGYRPPICPVGAPLSRHKMGKAIDIKVDGISAPEVQKAIQENYENIFKPLGLSAMELDTDTWTHLSVEWTLIDGLVLIPIYKRVNNGK